MRFERCSCQSAVPSAKVMTANITRLSDTDGNGTLDFEDISAILAKIECPKSYFFTEQTTRPAQFVIVEGSTLP